MTTLNELQNKAISTLGKSIVSANIIKVGDTDFDNIKLLDGINLSYYYRLTKAIRNYSIWTESNHIENLVINVSNVSDFEFKIVEGIPVLSIGNNLKHVIIRNLQITTNSQDNFYNKQNDAWCNMCRSEKCEHIMSTFIKIASQN
jgi:hypothetical protein